MAKKAKKKPEDKKPEEVKIWCGFCDMDVVMTKNNRCPRCGAVFIID